MKLETTRRDILKGSLAMAGLGVIGVPEWAMPHPGGRARRSSSSPTFRRTSGGTRRPIAACWTCGPSTGRSPRPTSSPQLSITATPMSTPPTFKLKISGMVNSARGAVARRPEEARQPRTRRRLRVLRQPRTAAGPVRQRQVDRRPAEDGDRAAGAEAGGSRHRVLRRGSRRGRSRVAHAEIQDRLSLRAQPAAREGDERRAVPRVGAQRPAADETPGRAASPASSPAGTAWPT